MSGSQTAANAISVAGAIRSGLIAAMEAAPEVLGIVAPEVKGVVYGMEAVGATAFGVGDGLASQNLGEGFTGAAAASATAIATAAAIAAILPEAPVLVVGVGVTMAALAADFTAKAIYNYVEENGDAILASYGQAEIASGQAELAMGQAIKSAIVGAANSIATSATSLATQLGQAEINNANSQLAAGQAINNWLGQAASSLGSTIGNAIQNIGGTLAQQQAAESAAATSIQQGIIACPVGSLACSPIRRRPPPRTPISVTRSSTASSRRRWQALARTPAMPR